MKTTRRFAAIAAAAMMTAALAVPMTSMNVFAASGDNEITISADSKSMTHSNMSAYQVFAGGYNTTDKNLTITGWGDGIDVVKFIKALKNESAFVPTVGDNTGTNVFKDVEEENTAATANAVADIVSGWTNDGARAKAFAKLALKCKSTTSSGTYSSTDGKITDLADGYYVIEDTDAAVTNPEGNGSAFTLGLLQVAGGTNVTVTPKLDYPTVVKKVKEDDSKDNTGNYGEGYNDVADWDVNTPVPFKIIATMPSNIGEYDHYYMEFNDTLDDNFGNPENIRVSVDESQLSESAYTVITTGNDMKITITDLKGISGVTVTEDSKVTVTYTAKLNIAADETSGAKTAVIGRPGQENKVDLTYSNNPNSTGDGTAKPGDTGKTPEDKVIVFTYELDITKIDGVTRENLEGAEFQLSKKVGNTPYWATVDTNGYFTGWVTNQGDATTLATDATGIFKIIGLDDGTYYLEETTPPTNYNKPSEAFTVVIDADTQFTQNDYDKDAANNEGGKMPLIDLTATVGGAPATVDKNKGIVSGTIENNKGSTLPTTGGIGTVLFYVVGGALVVGAGVTLITKKRVDKDAK